MISDNVPNDYGEGIPVDGEVRDGKVKPPIVNFPSSEAALNHILLCADPGRADQIEPGFASCVFLPDVIFSNSEDYLRMTRVALNDAGIPTLRSERGISFELAMSDRAFRVWARLFGQS